ncbi:MAG: LCP family protein [Actinomycetales bacterium]|nr:LCP family protein [Actinomycetales bacterium]
MLTGVTPRHAAVRRRGPGHARRLPRHRIRRAVGLTLVAVVGFVGTGAATTYARLQNNITSADVTHLLGEFRPPPPKPDPEDPAAGTPVNILVIGSDTRAGNERFATDTSVQGERSDTTIVVHISADRSRVELVSIPRDILSPQPECLRSDGTKAGARSQAMFNEAYSRGAQNGSETDGAACVQRTIEQLTGVYIHHFVIVDMTGFVDMVDAVGGIPMCIPEPINSPKAKLVLEAGVHEFDGVTALRFARARTGQGLDGSDTSRIGRQQELMAATARTVLSKNLLTDVPELVRFLNAATRSLTVSSGLAGIPDMTGLAYSLRGISPDDITFMTIPNRPYPENRNRLIFDDTAALVWANIANDVPMTTGIPGLEPTTVDPGTADPAAPTTPTPAPTRTPGAEPFTPADVTAVCG